jgi:hypothetical protein
MFEVVRDIISVTQLTSPTASGIRDGASQCQVLAQLCAMQHQSKCGRLYLAHFPRPSHARWSGGSGGSLEVPHDKGG